MTDTSQKGWGSQMSGGLHSGTGVLRIKHDAQQLVSQRADSGTSIIDGIFAHYQKQISSNTYRQYLFSSLCKFSGALANS
ncbi:hypothetical protein RRG08_053914 [Elysia crispata]|uniref:Uncharacterized protein n=1 Tax=Elysia crispata TaxID=231223 RepID=A0AAE0ZMD9_9GAST|nr:hypothetical protein RRG08_053914 [Elysia crispata]